LLFASNGLTRESTEFVCARAVNGDSIAGVKSKKTMSSRASQEQKDSWLVTAMDQPAPANHGRGIGAPVQKGKSGNPSGRPKIVTQIKELARAHGGEAFKKILELMRSDDERVAFAAAQEILNRAYGKPTQAVDVTHKREPADFSDAELYAIARGGKASDESSSRH
jgi:hypothetical protein